MSVETNARFKNNISLTQWAEQSLYYGSWDVDIVSDKLHWSDETYRIHELEIGIPITVEQAVNYYQESDRKWINEAIEKAIKQRKSWDFVLEITSHKGRQKKVRVAGRPIVDSSNTLTGLEGFFVDLEDPSENRNLGIDKIRSAYDLEPLMDEISIIGKTDKDGLIIYVNENFCELSGYSRSELMGKTHSVLNSGHHEKDFFKSMWNTIANGKKAWRGEIKNKKKDGDFFWVDMLIKPILDKNSSVVEYISVSRDITSSKIQLQADIKLERLAAIGETTSQIIHDVMNPLAIISGNVDRIKVMNEKTLDPEKLKKITDRLSNGVERIQSIFESLRSTLRGTDKVSVVSIRRTIEKAILELEDMVSENKFSIRFETEDDFDFIGNEGQLRQVFINLIKNAVQANLQSDERWLKINIVSNGDKRTIQFTDSGQGISTDNSAKVFNTLFTTKSDSGGTGLGLSLCKKIVEAHKGELLLNGESLNTQFEIKFPRL